MREQDAEMLRLWREGYTATYIARCMELCEGKYVKQRLRRLRKAGHDVPRGKPGRVSGDKRLGYERP